MTSLLFSRTCAPTICRRKSEGVRGEMWKAAADESSNRSESSCSVIPRPCATVRFVCGSGCALCVGVGVYCKSVCRCAIFIRAYFFPLLTSKSTTHIFFMPHLQPRIQTHLIHPIMHPVAKDGMMTLSSSSANKHPTPLYIVTFVTRWLT